MSAECEKHGVDLHGDTISGLVCPLCEVERDRDRWREEAWACYVESGADPDGETDGTRLNIGEAVYAVKELRSDEEAVGDEVCRLGDRVAELEQRLREQERPA